MTVVFALRCEGGLVMAADSQATEADYGVSYEVDKIHRLHERALWGGSGSRAVLQDLRSQLTETAPQVASADHLGQALQEQVGPILRAHYAAYIEDVPGEAQPSSTPTVHLLAAGYDAAGATWIVELDPHSALRRYEDLGFHAIGSGAALARQASVLLAHFDVPSQSLDHGLMIAVRVLDAISSTALAVGGPPNVWRVTTAGADRLQDEEIEAVRAEVDAWKQGEREALARILGNRS